MLSLKEYVKESTVGTSVAIIGAIIGYKFFKALLSGMTKIGLGVIAKNKIKELDNIQNEMISILDRYPNVKDYMLKNGGYKRILNSKGGKHDGFFFLTEFGFGLDEDISSFSDDDKTRFKQLFKEVRKLQDGVLQFFKEDELI